MKIQKRLLTLLVLALLLLTGCSRLRPAEAPKEFSFSSVPAYTGEPYTAVNSNVPFFTEEEITAKGFESYGPLDKMGRCTAVWASVGRELMPTEERGKIGSVKPTGWHTIKYDFVDGKYLYNRCHLIGFQLTGENANPQNLITGTRYLNIEGMLPFENMTADYVKETENHVMYRVTPIFEGSNLLASGVLMEGWSVEDRGEGVCFCIFAYNVQPGVEIDYATGESRLEEIHENEEEICTYVLNKNSMKFHRTDCPSVDTIKEENKEYYTGTRQELLDLGYEPCGSCKP